VRFFLEVGQELAYTVVTITKGSQCKLARKGCGGTLISAKQQCRRAPFCGPLLSRRLGDEGLGAAQSGRVIL
jgi:hypothetical protein